MIFDIRGVKISYPTPTDNHEKKVLERTVNLGIKEPSVLDFIDSMTNSSVFYDLGACVGVFSLYAAKKFHSVWSFEADPINYGRFVAGREKSFDQFPEHLNINQIAISNGKTNSETLLIEGGVNHAHHRILKTDQFAGAVYLEEKIKKSDKTYEIKVPAISVDQFVESPGVNFPTHMKVDIDGSELLFLQGAQSTLQDPRLKEILIELDKNSPHHNFIVKTLLDSGFRLNEENFIAHGGDSLYNIHFVRN